MQHLRFGIIYEKIGQDGESNYRVDPFFVKMHVYETNAVLQRYFPRWAFCHQD